MQEVPEKGNSARKSIEWADTVASDAFERNQLEAAPWIVNSDNGVEYGMHMQDGKKGEMNAQKIKLPMEEQRQQNQNVNQNQNQPILAQNNNRQAFSSQDYPIYGNQVMFDSAPVKNNGIYNLLGGSTFSGFQSGNEITPTSIQNQYQQTNANQIGFQQYQQGASGDAKKIQPEISMEYQAPLDPLNSDNALAYNNMWPDRSAEKALGLSSNDIQGYLLGGSLGMNKMEEDLKVNPNESVTYFDDEKPVLAEAEDVTDNGSINSKTRIVRRKV